MTKQIILSEPLVKAFLKEEELIQCYIELQKKIEEFKFMVKNHEWDTSLLKELFPDKTGAQIEILPSGQLSVIAPSLKDLRNRADQMGVDISHLGRKKRKILLLLDRLEKVDATESVEILIPKIGKT